MQIWHVTCFMFTVVSLNEIANRYDFRRENEFTVAKFHTEIRRKSISVVELIHGTR